MARRSSTAQRHAAQAHSGRTATRRTSTGTKTVARPMGRPTALTDTVEETILGYLIEGMPIESTCALAGVGVTTFYRWMQRGEDARETLDATGSLPETEERFRDFREAVLDARAQAEHRAVGIVNKAMHGGFVTSEEPVLDLNGNPVYDEAGKLVYKRTYTPPDGRLAMAYLQRARPKDWSIAGANINAKVEVSGPQGGPVEVHHSVEEVTSLTQRLLEVRRQFEEEEQQHAIDTRPAGSDVVDAEVVEES